MGRQLEKCLKKKNIFPIVFHLNDATTAYLKFKHFEQCLLFCDNKII